MQESMLVAITVLGLTGIVLGIGRLLLNVFCSRRQTGFLDVVLLGSWALAAAWMQLPAYFWLTAIVLIIPSLARCVGRIEHLHQRLTLLALPLHRVAFQAIALAGLSLGVVLWLAVEESPVPFDSTCDLELVENAGQLQAKHEASCAFTDRHRRIPLFTLSYPDEHELAKLGQVERQVISGWVDPPRVLKLEDANGFANCHGWVFTGGRYHVRCEDVPIILEENGYQPVAAPQPSDLIVYNLPAMEIIHTGIVHSVGVTGVILIESKWGKAGCYLHRPADQPYSASFHYYRSARQGHLLHELDGASTSTTAAP